jgi:hypothetical protein
MKHPLPIGYMMMAWYFGAWAVILGAMAWVVGH